MSNSYGLSGKLKKKGNKGPILELTWKTRFFTQTGPTELSYYTDETCTSKKGSIDLSKVTRVRNIDLANGFEVVTPNRTYVLQAPQETVRKFWVDELNARCPKLPGYRNAAICIASPVGEQPKPNVRPVIYPQPMPVRSGSTPVYLEQGQTRNISTEEPVGAQAQQSRQEPPNQSEYASFSSYSNSMRTASVAGPASFLQPPVAPRSPQPPSDPVYMSSTDMNQLRTQSQPAQPSYQILQAQGEYAFFGRPPQ